MAVRKFTALLCSRYISRLIVTSGGRFAGLDANAFTLYAIQKLIAIVFTDANTLPVNLYTITLYSFYLMKVYNAGAMYLDELIARQKFQQTL